MSNYALMPVQKQDDFKDVNELLSREDIIINSINYKTDISQFPLIIEIEYIKRQDSIHYKKLNNIKSDKSKIITDDEAVFKVENNNGPAIDSVNDVKESSVLHSDTLPAVQYDKEDAHNNNVNDKVIISASELKPYSESKKSNIKDNSKLYFMCRFILDNVENTKYVTAKNLKSAKDNLYNIYSRYKKSKMYNNVSFSILSIKEINKEEYDEAVNNK